MNPYALIGERYVDGLGRERTVPETTRAAFAALLGQADGASFVPPVTIVREGDPIAVDVTLPAKSWKATVLWTLTGSSQSQAGTLRLQDAPVTAVTEREGEKHDTRRITIPRRPSSGEHRLTLDVAGAGHAGLTVIVCPRAAHLPAGNDRAWGIAVQLYTLRSERNWGIGDFGDLDRLCAIAAEAGATYVGINPLHAAHRTDPEAASPYAPTSRHFLNWLAIDVEGVPEAAAAPVRAYVDSIADALAAQRTRRFVDYSAVARLKDAALRLCFAQLGSERERAFRAYAAAGGRMLRRFATFEALAARHGRSVANWPAGLRTPDSPDVDRFAVAEAPAEVAYAAYLQWCAAEQFGEVAARARALGVALYRDLAVGVESNGAEVWSEPEYVRSVSVGAPPDLLNETGQDWGLPPLSPTALSRDAYASFAALLADNMRNAGALRIDHAMSLRRLFWIPAGEKPTAGAYVEYPFEDLLGVLARESQRARCLVIGEDLGAVPEGFRERMAADNVLSYRILLFEREGDGSFVPPENYPALALAAVGTHDMPPLASWLRGDDIGLRTRLRLIRAERAERERRARRRDRAQLVEALHRHGDLGDATDDTAIILAAHRFLARTPARIVMVQLEDALGETTPVNIPGTHAEYPNWRRKIELGIDDVASDERFANLAATMRELRPRA